MTNHRNNGSNDISLQKLIFQKIIDYLSSIQSERKNVLNDIQKIGIQQTLFDLCSEQLAEKNVNKKQKKAHLQIETHEVESHAHK